MLTSEHTLPPWLWRESAPPQSSPAETKAFAVTGNPPLRVPRRKEEIVAAYPAVLPLGARIRVSGAGAYDGIYLVTEKGAAAKGRHIDLYFTQRRRS